MNTHTLNFESGIIIRKYPYLVVDFNYMPAYDVAFIYTW